MDEARQVEDDYEQTVAEQVARLQVMLRRLMTEVSARRDTAANWRMGSDEEWKRVASNVGMRDNWFRADKRARLADTDDRIADALELDLDALAAAIVALQQQDRQPLPEPPA